MATSSDSRKQAWKFQEGAVVIALRRLGIPESEIHWDHTPAGMSIDPDVVVGKNPDKPVAVIFVTHASAERAGEKKFWRTVAEAIEAKRLPSHPKILSILYPGNVKDALKGLYKSLFDSCIHLDETKYGGAFDAALSALTDKHGKKAKDDCLSVLEDAVSAGKVPEFSKFKTELKKMLVAPAGPKHSLMASSSFAGKGRTPAKARQTSLRRSVCKLYTMPDDVRDALLGGASVPSLVPHGLLLGWFSEGISGDIELVDGELQDFLATADPPTLEFLFGVIDDELPSFRAYAATLEASGECKFGNVWILDHFDDLRKPTGMASALEEVYRDPVKPLKAIAGKPIALRSHWLFQGLMAMLRTETGRADGYGYSVLGTEAGREREINAFAGTTIAPYINRQKNLAVDLREDIARVLAGHLTRLGRRSCESLLGRSAVVAAESVFNFQMMNYRFFNPVDWLVSRRLREERISHELPANHDSFLSTSVDAVPSRTGNLIKVDDGRVWIKCQSAYDGRIDKRKELCGRVGAMKLCYSAKDLLKRRFLLVIDGSFDDEDLRLFVQAGWDGVYYYDELDELVAEVRA